MATVMRVLPSACGSPRSASKRKLPSQTLHDRPVRSTSQRRTKKSAEGRSVRTKSVACTGPTTSIGSASGTDEKIKTSDACLQRAIVSCPGVVAHFGAGNVGRWIVGIVAILIRWHIACWRFQTQPTRLGHPIAVKNRRSSAEPVAASCRTRAIDWRPSCRDAPDVPADG